MRTKLPEIAPMVDDPAIRCRDQTAKEKMKRDADKRKNAKLNTLQIGDNVLVKQRKYNKFSTCNNPEPYCIIAKKGSMITAENSKHTITRNLSHFKKIQQSPSDATLSDDDDEDETVPLNDGGQAQVLNEPQRRYYLRGNRGQPPRRLGFNS